MPCNNDPLNFGSTFPDIQQFLVPVKSLDVILFHQSISPVKLNGVVGTTIHDFRAIEFAHGGFLGKR
jgi:hypothetical protein